MKKRKRRDGRGDDEIRKREKKMKKRMSREGRGGEDQ